MPRAYKMKGQKRKSKGERYDREEEQNEFRQIENGNASTSAPKKARVEDLPSEKEEKSEAVIDSMPGIPIALVDSGHKKPGVIFILEKASLEVGSVGNKNSLLSSDEHADFLKKHKRNPADFRPDIAFQAILTILDSRVNKCGRLKALYVKTLKNDLIKIEPHVRIPRTFKRFAGLMVELLQNRHIKAAGKGEQLLSIIKHPVTNQLPVQCRKIGLSHSSEKLVDMNKYVGTINNELDLVFVVGAMSHGKIEENYVDDYISVSEYPLSAAYCISIITNAVEQKWKIL